MVLHFDEAGYAGRGDGYLLRQTPRSQSVKPTWIGYRLKSWNILARKPASDHERGVDQDIVNIMIGFAPVRPAEFVIIQILQIAGQAATRP
jgi:hypothetical protein